MEFELKEKLVESYKELGEGDKAILLKRDVGDLKGVMASVDKMMNKKENV